MPEWSENPDLKSLAFYAIRKDSLCSKISACTSAKEITCRGCGLRYQPSNILTPDPCPKCGSKLYNRERCGDCPVLIVDRAFHTSAGALLSRAQHLLYALKKGFSISMDEVDADVFLASEIYDVEIEKYQKTLNKDK